MKTFAQMASMRGLTFSERMHYLSLSSPLLVDVVEFEVEDRVEERCSKEMEDLEERIADLENQLCVLEGR